MQTESPTDVSSPLYPPGPKNMNPFGFMRDVQRNPPLFLLRVAQEYGGIARFRAGFLHVYLIAHPDAIRHVLRDHHKNYSKNTFTYKMTRSVTGPGLLTMDGEQWLERRRILQPIFARDRIANLDTTITDATTAVLERWRRQVALGDPIDLNAEMVQLTLVIASKAFFDIDIRDDHDEIRRAMSTISAAFIHRFRSRLAAIWGVLGFPALENRRLGLAKQALEKVAQHIIDELRNRGNYSDNLLAQLAQASDPETGSRLSDQELKSEILTLLLAGHETTAYALTWALYLLSCHPDAQQQLADEVSIAVGKGIPTAHDLPKLIYTQMVIDETLRLYPPIWAFSRRAEQDDIVCGHRIPKGARLLVSPYVAHRLPEFWPEPECFLPERFSPEWITQRPSHAYIPFGAGPRQCIGKRFATLQMQLILPMVMQKYRVEVTSSQPIVPEASVTLQPARPILISLTPANA